ncbi:MAG: type II secretion system protein [Acidimicrobiales bacterium]|nr:type II secretion system protein [Acidimicrobiales bacterium]
MDALLMALFGALIGFGLLLVSYGVRGQQVLPDIEKRDPNAAGGVNPRLQVAGVFVGLVAGFGLYSLTGWPVLGVFAFLVASYLPRLVGDGNEVKAEIAKTEAIATWCEMVRDSIAGAAGLEQALLASGEVAPIAIRPEVHRFVGRVERMPLTDALIALGDDLDHASSDMIVVALVNAVRMEARDLAPLLTRLAMSIREDVRTRQRVLVGRARIRTSARIVIGVTVLTMTLILARGGALLEPYDTFFGQIWLALCCATFTAGAFLLRSFGQLEMPERFSARRVRQESA